MTAKVTANSTRVERIPQRATAQRAARVLDVGAEACGGAKHGMRITVPSNAAAGEVVTNTGSSSFAVG